MHYRALNFSIGDLPQIYHRGMREIRLWGDYEVVDFDANGTPQFCEKIINIKARAALSLQRHCHRSEAWHLLQGTLLVIQDGCLIRLNAGDKTFIPPQAIHSIVNLSARPAILHEMQAGLCLEEDNERLCDINGRSVSVFQNDVHVLKNIALYKAVTRGL